MVAAATAPCLHRPSSASGPPERQSSGRPQGIPPPQPAARSQAPPARAAAPEAEPAPAEEQQQQHMPEAQLRSKAKGLLAELYNTKDVKEAVACVK